ncbi:MAG: hypothetical protein KDB56_16765, partial [Mycobacterium sp.]|nr:hypothetical protein [Mycobacterium sp.]
MTGQALGLTATSPLRSTYHVGRVGALAVALGVGTAILGFTATAAAETGRGDAAGSAGEESSRSGNSRTAPANNRPGNRRNAPAAAKDAAPASAPDVPTIEAANGGTVPTTALRRSAGRSALTDQSAEARNTTPDALAETATSADSPVPASLPSSDGAAGMVDDSAPSPVADLLSAVSSGDALAQAAATPEIAAAPQIPSASAAQQAPVMTAAPADALAEADADPSALLGAGGGGLPGAETLAWAALAAARREDLAGATPEVAPAAAVGTAEPADPAADVTESVTAAKPSIASISPGSGFVGSQVVITGANLAGANEIKFCSGSALCSSTGGVKATTYSVDSSTQITVTVPSGASTGKIFVSTPGFGNSATSSQAYTVNTPKIASLSPTSGPVGSTVVITGSFLDSPTSVSFCGSSSKCASGVAAEFTADSSTQITATVPNGADTGPIQVTVKPGTTPITATSSQSYKVVNENAPTITSFTPGNGYVGSSVVITGENFDNATSVTFCAGSSNCSSGVQSTFTVDSNTQITAIAPNALSGQIEVITPDGKAISTDTYNVALAPLPDLPAGGNAVSSLLATQRGKLTVAIADAVVAALPSAGPSLVCTSTGCAIPAGQTGPSVADQIGMYGFGVIYALTGNLSDAVVGQQVSALATQPAILSFISQTVAEQLSPPGAPGPVIPPDVALTVGNTVATFVEKAFGNSTVATAFAPFLRALNLPTTYAGALDFIGNLADGLNAALFARFQPKQAQTALIGFFTNSAVQTALGPGTAGEPGALTTAFDVLLGLATPDWTGAPQPSPNAIAGYLGEVVATTVLGADNPGTPALAATVGAAAQTLFATIGTTVATAAGQALVTLLNGPANPNVPTVLADFMVNAVFTFLQGPDGTKPLPFPEQPLLPSLANAAGVAASGFVTSVFSDPAVPAALGTFVSQLITGLTGSPAVQDEIGQQVAASIATALGGGPLAVAVGPIIGGVVELVLANPTVADELSSVIGSAVPGFLGQPGVVAALAAATGLLATAVLDGADPASALAEFESALRTSSAIVAAVRVTVSSVVEQLLSDTAVWQVVDAALEAVVTSSLSDPQIQQTLSQAVALEVTILLGGGPIGIAVGEQVGAAAVSVLSNPVVSAALAGLVDTVFTDFFGTPGVVPALSNAAGTLAAAAVAGELATVLPRVEAQLRASAAIQAGVQKAVGDAVTQLLSDTALWNVVDAAMASLISGILTSAQVQGAVFEQVSDEVSTLLGGGELGAIVGEQVGDAVVDLMANPVVATALVDLVDTVTTDFFTTPGVVAAFADAADAIALAAVTTGNIALAIAAAEQALQANPAVRAGVEQSIGAAVTQLFGDTALWQAVDGELSTLITELLADKPVQDAVGARVGAEVSALLGGGDLGDLVGQQVGDAVVNLMANPVVSTALVGLLDTVTGDFFGTPGVVPALSAAASQLALAVIAGEPFPAALAAVQEALRANAAIQAGVQLAVGDAVTDLLSDTALWQAVDGELSTLITELLADQPVQDAVGARVAAEVSTLLGGGDLGAAVGKQVGDAVVTLMANPVVATALVDLVDTLTSDFFSTPGVIPAFADAADAIALAALTTGNIVLALADAEAQLRANPAIQTGVDNAVTDALTQLLGDTALWQAVDGELSTLITGLLADPQVQTAVGTQVGAQVSAALGGGDLGDLVGQQVGDAVVNLMANPVVSTALVGLLDTVTGDFFGTPGVVAALAGAAGELAAAAVAGTLDTVQPLVEAQLRANADIQAGLE